MDATQDAVLAALAQVDDDAAGLYPFRLRHCFTGNAPGGHRVVCAGAGVAAACVGAPAAHRQRRWPPCRRTSAGGYDGPGIQFDNERGVHDVAVAAFSIDRAPVSNAQVLAFVESGAFAARTGAAHPRTGAAMKNMAARLATTLLSTARCHSICPHRWFT